MEYLKEIDWNALWYSVKDIVLPYIGTLLLYLLLFTLLGLILGILYNRLLRKKGILIRKPKYYSWAVKLYRPLMIIAFLYVFVQIGLIKGVFRILEKEKEPIVNGMYQTTLGTFLESDESKEKYLEILREAAKEAKEGSQDWIAKSKQKIAAYQSGGLPEKTSKIVHYFQERYGDAIYKATLYSMVTIANFKTNNNYELKAQSFQNAMGHLNDSSAKEIETEVNKGLTTWYSSFMKRKCSVMVKGLLWVLIFMIGIPWLEYLIYKKWVLPKYLEQNEA